MKMCYFSAAINTSYKGVQKYLCVCLKTRLSGSFFSDRLGKAILHDGSLDSLEKLCLHFTMEEEFNNRSKNRVTHFLLVLKLIL